MAFKVFGGGQNNTGGRRQVPDETAGEGLSSNPRSIDGNWEEKKNPINSTGAQLPPARPLLGGVGAAAGPAAAGTRPSSVEISSPCHEFHPAPRQGGGITRV